MKRTTLSLADAAWLEETFARNRATFGGFFMGPEDDADDTDADDQDDDSGADDGDDDEPDWKAKYEAQQRINRNLERRTRKDAARLKQLEGGKPDDKSGKADEKKDDAPSLDEIRAEVEREALHGRIEDKIEAKAHAFADPEDAVAVLLRSHDINDFLDENNKIDVEAITEALKELGEKKPHLLAQGGRFQGGADGGARKGQPTRPKSLGEAIARNYKS